MIKYFETYIEDDDEWIECPSDYEFEPGERVKMNPDSIYKNQTRGKKEGYIENKLGDEDVWIVEWDQGAKGCFYYREDLLIKNKDRRKVKWFYKGKLEENKSNDKLDLEIGDKIIIDGTIDGRYFNDVEATVVFIYKMNRWWRVKPTDGSGTWLIDDDDFDKVRLVSDDEKGKVKWYYKGKLEENKLYEANKNIGRRVKINDKCGFEQDAYIRGGNGEGEIYGYLGREFYYPYQIKWDNGVDGVYRKSDFDYVVEEEDNVGKVKWYYKGKLDEELAIEEVEQPEVSIDAHDYLETWESTIKDKYRNLETGEVKRLHEIFEIPKYFPINKYIGIYDKDGNFKLIDQGYKMNFGRIDYRENNTLHIEEIVRKNGPNYLDFYVGDKFDIRNDKPHGKHKYWKFKNRNHIIVPKLRFTICRLYEYYEDFREIFSGRKVEITTKEGDKKIFRVPRKDVMGDSNLEISNTTFILYLYKNHNNEREVKYYDVDVFKPAKSEKYYTHINPSLDPYGEEDWDEDDYMMESVEGNWVGIFDFLQAEDNKIELYDVIRLFIDRDDPFANMEVRNFLAKFLKGKRIKILCSDGTTISMKKATFDHKTFIPNYPNLCFMNPITKMKKYLKTEDFCNNPNKHIKVYLGERIYSENDPYGEENWDD